MSSIILPLVDFLLRKLLNFNLQVVEYVASAALDTIAGSTFGIAFNKEKNDFALKKYLGHKSVSSFQKAIELAPDSVSYGINEAVMYVELSMVDSKVMPMTGAQKLLALDKKHPDNVNINLQLGRLSFTRSGDYKKAIPRFEKVLELSTSDSEKNSGAILEAHFSLAESYKKLGDKEKTIFHYLKCIQLTEGNPEVQNELKTSLKKYETEGI